MCEKARTCPSCGAVMARGTRVETLVFQGHSASYHQPGWHCAACGESVIAGADGEAFDAALQAAMAAARGAEANRG